MLVTLAELKTLDTKNMHEVVAGWITGKPFSYKGQLYKMPKVVKALLKAGERIDTDQLWRMPHASKECACKIAYAENVAKLNRDPEPLFGRSYPLTTLRDLFPQTSTDKLEQAFVTWARKRISPSMLTTIETGDVKVVSLTDGGKVRAIYYRNGHTSTVTAERQLYKSIFTEYLTVNGTI